MNHAEGYGANARLSYFILFYFILFYFILFYFILFYLILFYFIYFSLANVASIFQLDHRKQLGQIHRYTNTYTAVFIELLRN